MTRIIPAAILESIAPPRRRGRVIAFVVAAALLCTSCELPQPGRSEIRVSIQADASSVDVRLPAGSTVSQALEAARLTTDALDRTEPPSYAVLEGGDSVRLIRVEERFRTEIRSIPFEKQVLRNEALPEGEERLVQAGVNGEEEVTYRALIEDGNQISEAMIKNTMITDAIPEIVMLGARSAVAPLAITGRIAYLSAGNAWLMETSTSSRRLIVKTGDLDGHVFRLSGDGKFLLFTRRSTKPIEQEINTLWIAPVDSTTSEEIAVKTSNVIHFADWFPDSSTHLAYSTVEPRANAPGWQANNDLYRAAVGVDSTRVLDAQSGGVYGWWGTSYLFSRSGRLAYSRPDGVGIVIQDGGYLAPVLKVTPFQTRGDWAWSPGIAWAPDSQTIYVVDHAAAPATAAEESPLFDLKAISLTTNTAVTLASNVGMFAGPVVSPVAEGDKSGSHLVAFLQATFPEQSATSRYRLVVIDRDGSDRRELFPPADQPGLEPQSLVWSPRTTPGEAGPNVCVVYRGDLWLIDSGNGLARQITNDGLVSGVDWK